MAMSFSVRRIKEPRPRRSWPWQKGLLIALSVARPLLGWYRAWRAEKREQQHRILALKRLFLVLVAVLFSLVVVAGLAKTFLTMGSWGLSMFVSVAGAELPKDTDGFTNVLLLGQGDEGHDGVDLTDTIMVASFDPTQTKSVVVVSLPRDLYLLKTEKMGAGRINSLYRDYKGHLLTQGLTEEAAIQEGMRELAAEIGRQMGLTLHHVVKADFIGFVKAVDAVDGVDVDVPYSIVDTEYPDENYGYQTFAINAGLQHLDGETALKYARSRHTTSDFDRSARQQQVLVALAEKAKSMGIHTDIGTITDLYAILSEHVATTLTSRELIAFAGLAEQIDRSRVITMQLSDRNGLYNSGVEAGGFLYGPPRDQFGGASVLLPVSIPEFPVTWKQIKTLTQVLYRNRAVHLAHPRIAVLNAGARSGLGRAIGGELMRYGFEVPVIENAEGIEDQPSSFIVARSPADQPLAELFGSLLLLPVQTAPIGLPPESLETVTIFLGKDYAYQPLQALVPLPE